MTDGDSVTINHLCDSANGTFVTLDNDLPLTGYEPDATELSDAVFSDINFQDSLDYTAPSSDLQMDDDAFGKLLAEVYRDYADYRCAEGVSVSPSSMSVMVDRTGEPVEEMIAEERESSSAQIRTLLNEQRKTIIAEYCEKVSHHELLAVQAEQERRILQGELLRQQQDFREVHQQDLIKMKELQKIPKILPSMSSPDRSSSRIRRPLWNYLEDFKNCRMK